MDHKVMYLAHIKKQDDSSCIMQTMKEHLYNVAQYAAEHVYGTDFAHTGYLTGLLHDMGKFSSSFQNYLRDSFEGKKVIKGSVIHTFTGVIYLFEKYHREENSEIEKLTCEIMAYAIGSHHGLFDLVNLKDENGFEHRLNKSKAELGYEEAVAHFFEEVCPERKVEELFNDAKKEMEELCAKIDQKCQSSDRGIALNFTLGLVARMVLSAVIAADRLDTGNFMVQAADSREMAGDRQLWQRQLDYMLGKMKNFRADTDINIARKYISETAAMNAERSSGIYRINVPTGGGKTLTTLRYALEHAKKFNKKRIFFFIPLLSVLEQNSKVIKKYILDQEIILEHHSNVLNYVAEGEKLDQYELLTQTWSKPVVISTMVQLLLVFFKDKTSTVRRFSALNNSVIILDEIQQLPVQFTAMFNMVLNFLTSYCNCTIVLSSATQPCLEDVRFPIQLAEKPDLVPYNKEIFQIFNRNQVIDKTSAYRMSMAELTGFVKEQIELTASVLVICNTKANAATLFNLVKDNVDGAVSMYHLSTSMCMQHRIDTMEKIGATPGKEGGKVICIATQLVEAGVDFSFQTVIRVKAGLDNIVQAAGRGNRSWEWNENCSVYVVDLKEEKLTNLKEIEQAQKCFNEFRENFMEKPKDFDHDFVGEKAISQYYHYLFQMQEQQFLCRMIRKPSIDEELLRLLSDNRKHVEMKGYDSKYLMNQAFKTAGELFEVFDNTTTDVIVPYNEEAKSLIADMNSSDALMDLKLTKEIMKRAKPYIVSIYEYQKKKLDDMHMLQMYGDNRFLSLDEACYDKKKLGLVFDACASVEINML